MIVLRIAYSVLRKSNTILNTQYSIKEGRKTEKDGKDITDSEMLQAAEVQGEEIQSMQTLRKAARFHAALPALQDLLQRACVQRRDSRRGQG